MGRLSRTAHRDADQAACRQGGCACGVPPQRNGTGGSPQRAVQEIARIQASLVGDCGRAPEADAVEDEAMQPVPSADEEILRTLTTALQTSKAATQHFNGKRKAPPETVEDSDLEDDAIRKAVKAVGDHSRAARGSQEPSAEPWLSPVYRLRDITGQSPTAVTRLGNSVMNDISYVHVYSAQIIALWTRLQVLVPEDVQLSEIDPRIQFQAALRNPFHRDEEDEIFGHTASGVAPSHHLDACHGARQHGQSLPVEPGFQSTCWDGVSTPAVACPTGCSDLDDTHSEKRSPVHSCGKRVQFSHEVTFWFPGPEQLSLSEPSIRLANKGNGLQGGSCRSLVHPLNHTSPCQRVPMTFSSNAASRVPKVACKTSTEGFQGGSCRTLILPLPNCDHPSEAVLPCKKDETPSADAVVQGNTSHGTVSHPARHVGFRQPDNLNRNPCELLLQGFASFAESDNLHPPVLDFARKKPQAKSAAFKMGAAPYVPTQHEHPGLHRPLSEARHFRVEEPCRDAMSASFPSPFTSFDAVNGPRVLAGEPEWLPDQYIIFALDTARLPGNPLPRFLKFELIDYPGPQVVITLDHGAGSFRAVVFDFRPLQGDIEVIDVPPFTTFIEQIRTSKSIPDVDRAVNKVTGNACTTLLNGIIVAPSGNIPFDADLVLFKLWQDGVPVDTWRPFQFGDLRPPVPPIPEDALPARPMSVPRTFAASSSSQAAALPRYQPVTVFAPEPRYSYMGVLEGVQNRPKPQPANDMACVQDVLAFLPRRGGPLDARVIPKPLPGLYTPQILVSRVLVQSGWHTICIDLRMLNLGIKVANVRLGSSIRQLFAFDSPLQSELIDLGRGHLPLSFSINLAPCVVDTAFHVEVNTLSVYPQQSSQGHAQVSSQAAPARWHRRLVPVHPDRVHDLAQARTALFTVFDAVHHQRTFRRDESDEIETLVAKAISVTPEISNAEGFLIFHGVAELPSPQIVLKSKDTEACVVPLLFKLHPATVCTVEAPARASSFDVALLAARACSTLKGAHHQLARRTANIVGHHGTVDPFKAGAVVMHEALVLRGFSLGNNRRPRASHDLQFASNDWIEARQWDPHDDYQPSELNRIVVHVARAQTGSVHVVPTATLRQIRDYICVSSPHEPPAALQWPLVCPAIPGAAPVALYLTPEAMDEAAHWATVDIRRVGHAPLSPFIVLPLPPFLDLTVLLELVRSEIPSLRPIGGAYLNEYAVTNTLMATSPAMTVTLMRSVPRSTPAESLPVPALDLNIDLLERRTALRATFNRNAGQGWTSCLQAGTGGISSASSSITEDATDAGASFHSGSVNEQLDEDVDEVIPVITSVTSTSTYASEWSPDAVLPSTTSTTSAPSSGHGQRHSARPSSPLPRACNLVSSADQVSAAAIRVFAACGEHRPLHITLQPLIPPASIGDILGQLTIRFDDLGVLPNAAKWILSSRALCGIGWVPCHCTHWKTASWASIACFWTVMGLLAYARVCSILRVTSKSRGISKTCWNLGLCPSLHQCGSITFTLSYKVGPHCP